MSAAISQRGGVLLLTRSLNYGGSERQLVNLATGLKKRGMNVTVATFYAGGALTKELESERVAVLSLQKHSRWELFGFVLRSVQLFRRIRPAILHSYLPTANILAALLKPFCPPARIVWGIRASRLELDHYGWMNRIQLWFESKLSVLADLIIVNSKAGFDDAVRRGFSRNRMIVIPNGIDVHRFCPDPDARSRTRQAWGIANHERLIGLIGRLDPMKGHDNFIKAAALLTQTQDNIRFVCVGDGPETYKNSLEELSDGLGLGKRLLWAKASEDVQAIYNALDLVTACSSYGEGFPNVIAEAMACGKVCIVTDVGDAKHIVEDTGYVVARGNPDALVSAWQKALAEQEIDRTLRSERARDRVVKCFSLERLLQETTRALQTLGTLDPYSPRCES
jgi:glycosyltransferase involved in cell wall biosynthesis